MEGNMALFNHPDKSEKIKIKARYQTEISSASADRSLLTPSDQFSWHCHNARIQEIQERYEKEMGYRPL
jgi:hypothetical protein